MSKFNRMNEFFEGDFDAEEFLQEQENALTFDGFVYNVNLPEAPDRVSQTVKVVNGRLTIHLEFEFEDFEVMDSPEDM